MRALCLILDPNPKDKMKDASGLRFITDWWAASIRLLNRPTLLQELLGYDMDNMDEKVVKNLG
jgi:dynein heavy chain